MTDLIAYEDLRIAVRAIEELYDFEVVFLGDGQDIVRLIDPSMIGVDPSEVFGAGSPLRATLTPHKASIGCCDCGILGCGSIDVTVTRDDDHVYWTLDPWDTTIRFPADAYDVEVERALADHDWETPDRTTSRLIVDGLDRTELAARGLRLQWASGRRGSDEISIAFESSMGPYQLVLTVHSEGDPPALWASRALACIAQDTRLWPDVVYYPQLRGLGAPSFGNASWTAGA